MIRHFLLAAFTGLLGLTAAAQTTVEREGEPTVTYAEHGSAMEAAIAEAQASFDHFLEAKAAGVAPGESFTVKVGFADNTGSFEHIWVDAVRAKGEGFAGILANQPLNLRDYSRLGEPVKFTRDQVSDWGYIDGDRLRGHFTTRLLLGNIPEDEAAGIAAMLHDQPLP
ncbi:MAG: DUF2314 domain-containing protein [Pseudomonadota bacterium]